jgi:hypothetical protein
MRHAPLAFLLLLCACAVPQPEPQPPSLRPAFDALAIGKSTRADVRAALGDGVAIDFSSGYEVWVYRDPLRRNQPPPPTEYVLLFAPSGVLAKKRQN